MIDKVLYSDQKRRECVEMLNVETKKKYLC